MRRGWKKYLLLGMASVLLSGTMQNTQVHAEEAMETGEESFFGCEGFEEFSPALVENLKQLDCSLQGIEAVTPFMMDGNSDVLVGTVNTPTTGDLNTLVVMVDFADVKFGTYNVTEESVEEVLFGEADSSSGWYPQESLRAYYERASFGKLSFHGEVKSITLDNTREYYTTTDENPEGELHYREELWEKLRAMGIDWSEYDTNGDYYIDAICLVVAGEAGEWSSQWWSHCIPNAFVSLDDTYKIANYVECMEPHMGLPNTVIHEFGHSLGLPDLYDTADGIHHSSGGIHTTDIMGTGSGDLNALCKMLLGWLDEEQVQMVEYGSDLSTITLESYPATGSCAVLFVDEDKQSLFGEYYLVQYNDFSENNAGHEWRMENENLQIYHVNAELAEDGYGFAHDNSTSGDCKLIEGVDKDAHIIHGLHGAGLGGTDVFGKIFEHGVPVDGYDCGYLEGDDLTPYTAPSTGKYAADRLDTSPDVFSGLHVTEIKMEGDKASFDVFYENEPTDTNVLKFAFVEEFKNCELSGLQMQLVANNDIWKLDEEATAYLKEKDGTEPAAIVFVDMEFVWPNVMDYYVGHSSLKATLDSSATLKEGTEYELVFPAGMFVTSYGATSEEVVVSGIKTRSSVITGQCGDNLTWTIEGDTLTISGTGDMWDYVPSADGENVVAPWMEHKDGLTTLKIEDGITSIGDYAFYFCNRFVGELTIPDGVTSIGKYAFASCGGFKGNLVLGDSLTTIGDRAFWRCYNLTGIVEMPMTLIDISQGAFEECNALKGMTFFGDTLPDMSFLGLFRENFEVNYPVNAKGWEDVIKAVNHLTWIPVGEVIEEPGVDVETDEDVEVEVDIPMTEEEHTTFVEAVVTPEEKAAMEAGAEAVVKLAVANAENTLAEADSQKLEQLITEAAYTVGSYLDITLSMQVGGLEKRMVTETAVPVEIVIAVPEGLRQTDNVFSVIRIHDGEVSVLKDLDENPDTVTIQTDRFSSYTLVYKEAQTRKLGDINNDGEITAVDKKLLYNHIAGTSVLTGDDLTVADVNGDGDVTAIDKKLLYNHIAGTSLLW